MANCSRCETCGCFISSHKNHDCNIIRKKASETKKSLFREGKIISHSKGKTKDNYEPLHKISKALKGVKKSKEHSAKIVATRKKLFEQGKLRTNSECLKKRHKEGTIVPWNKGYGDYVKGVKNPIYGKKRSKKTRALISKVNKGKHFSPRTEFKKGENHIFFNNWSSREPYGKDFSPELKIKVRDRDNFICQECGKKTNQLKRKLCVHHIDYNKENNEVFNLISLCQRCHTSTNTHREHWKKYFQMKTFIKELFNPQNIVAFENNKLIAMGRI